jgi:hypothetical protein
MSEIPRALRQAEFAGGVSLLTSAGTLVCCTMPALLVAVGAGAALASAVSAFPALVWLSEYKGAVFGSAGAMLIIAGVTQWRARSAPCPADPVLANACLRARRISRRVYAVSILTFGVGAFFAFALPSLI